MPLLKLLPVVLFALCWQPTDTAEDADVSRLYLAGSVPLWEEEVWKAWKVHSFLTPPRQHNTHTKKIYFIFHFFQMLAHQFAQSFLVLIRSKV